MFCRRLTDEQSPGVALGSAFYSRFTARDGAEAGVPGSDLLSGPGELTEAGSVFVNTYKDLQRCKDITSSLDTATPMANDDPEPSAQIAGENCTFDRAGQSSGPKQLERPVHCGKVRSTSEYC